MSSDDRQHQMDFILQQQAAFSSDMVEMKERLNQQGENIDKLAGVVAQLAQTVESHRQETQEAINGLIVASEATRELANKAAKLAIGISQRLNSHEQQPHERTDLGDPS
jgi:chromosome segregation ATPase